LDWSMSASAMMCSLTTQLPLFQNDRQPACSRIWFSGEKRGDITFESDSPARVIHGTKPTPNSSQVRPPIGEALMAVTFPRYQTRGDHQTQIHAQYTLRRRSSVNSVVPVNVVLPRDVEWQHKLVHTAARKKRVAAPVALEKRTSGAEALISRSNLRHG
jgi:hypothetical protein